MRLSGPLLTLTAAGGLAAVLVVSNVVAGTAASSPAAAPEQVAPQPAAPDEAPAEAPEAAPGDAESSAGPDPEAAAEPAAGTPAEDEGDGGDGAAAAADAAVTWTYAGEVHGTELTTALRVSGDEVVAYVCDGADYEIWLRGTAEDGVLELAGEADSRMSGAYTPELAAGVLWVGDSQWTFATTTAEWPDWAPPVPDDAPTQE